MIIHNSNKKKAIRANSNFNKEINETVTYFTISFVVSVSERFKSITKDLNQIVLL